MSDKKTLFVNNKEIEFTDEKNLLEVMRKAGIHVPTLCYRPDLTQFGACRMCVVEIEGRGIQSSCTMPPEAGLKISTNTERTRRIRKTVLELLLADHDRECTTCDRSGNCELQKYSDEYGIKNIKYAQKEEFLPIDNSNPALVRNPNKCIKCGACVRACSEYQGHSVLAFANRGSKTVVEPMAGKDLSSVDCVFCGQCQAVCPVGAITIKSEVETVWDLVTNKNKKVVAQIAPSVRVAVGEEFGLESGENTIKLIAAAMKQIGFDLVFDTNFSADLTIMEEATEFVERLQSNGAKKLPMFTSCCPAWVRYMETQHPDMLDYLSTCKSPQGMLSPILKELVPQYFDGVTKENMVVVSVMPCTAKKIEAKRSQLIKETDYVMTTQELVKMIKSSGVDFKALEPVELDSPFGEYSGAGTIFGSSGGVAEAALRTAYELATGEELADIDIKQIRGLEREKTVEVDVKGTKVKVKVVNTLKQAEKVIQEIKAGKADYHLVEVMACPGGCINGGGQPISCNNIELRKKRSEGLYKDDINSKVRKSHMNPSIHKLYNEFLQKPGSHKAHEFLHTTYSDMFKNSYRDLK